MPTTPPTRQTEARIRRIISAAITGGLQVAEVVVEPDGTIRLLRESPKTPQGDTRKPKEW